MATEQTLGTGAGVHPADDVAVALLSYNRGFNHNEMLVDKMYTHTGTYEQHKAETTKCVSSDHVIQVMLFQKLAACPTA